MASPDNSRDLTGLRKLLDRVANVQPSRQCMPDLIVGQWLKGDPESRRTIEEGIDRLPKRKKST